MMHVSVSSSGICDDTGVCQTVWDPTGIHRPAPLPPCPPTPPLFWVWWTAPVLSQLKHFTFFSTCLQCQNRDTLTGPVIRAGCLDGRLASRLAEAQDITRSPRRRQKTEKTREAQKSADKPREARNGPEKPRKTQKGPETPRAAQRGSETSRNKKKNPGRRTLPAQLCCHPA